MRRYQVSDAATHDSKVLDDILDGDNTALGVWADSAYRSAEIEAALKEKGLRSRIHRKARRNKPLSEREKQGNKTRSSVRVRVEHVFGAQSNDMRNLSTTLRHRRFLFTDSFLLLWKWRVG